MNKNLRITLILAALAVAGYLGYRWWQNRQASASPTGSFGSNLNSVAPELVGGSAGPSAGPAVDLPINITLTSQPAAPSSANPVWDQDRDRIVGPDNGDDMESADNTTESPFDRANPPVMDTMDFSGDKEEPSAIG